MEYRALGGTGIRVSEVGFGCGDTAGLMISGTPEERRQAVARALEVGINYFDTAPVYGGGVSESHLGQALRELGARPVVATKVRLLAEDLEDPSATVVRSVEGSLRRLGMDGVDVVQLHNRVAAHRGGNVGSGPLLAVEDVLGARGVLEGFRKLRQEGKARALGCCGFGGETASINAVVETGGFDSILVYYNLLNPTAGMPAPPGFRGADYGRIMDRAAAHGMGVVVLRVLAAGALSGQEGRHPLAGPRPSAEYQADVERARAVRFFEEQADARLSEVAMRFALMRPEVSTVLVGFSSVEHIDQAARSSGAGPLPAEALARLAELYRTDFGRNLPP